MSGIDRPQAVIEGTAVALTAFDYDMRDRDGPAGTSYNLWVLNPAGSGMQKVKVRRADAAAVSDFLKVESGVVSVTDSLSIACTMFARAKGNGAEIEYTAERITNSDTGEILAAKAPVRAAS